MNFRLLLISAMALSLFLVWTGCNNRVQIYRGNSSSNSDKDKGDEAGSVIKVDGNLSTYKKVDGISGSLDGVGSDTLLNLVSLWGEKFNESYKSVKIQVEGKGSSTAPTALIEGTAQFGPMSRKMKQDEIDKIEKKYGYKPTRIAVALDALAVFVHKDNPVDQLSLEELDGIFSLNRKSGYKKELKTWGQLGAQGDLKGMPISLYGRNSASGTYGYFKKVALFKGDFKKGVKEQPGSSAVVDGVANEKSAIGYSGIGYLTSSVKAVKLSKKKGGDGYHPTYENVLSGKYPLSRALYIYILKEPNKPLEPLVKEFLTFILSKEGQRMVVKDGYLPLTAEMAKKQLKKIGVDLVGQGKGDGAGSVIEVDEKLNEYSKVNGISGSLNGVGSDTLLNLVTLWGEKFNESYKSVKIQVEGKGSSTAPTALIEGTAQFGPMSRKMKQDEIDKIEKKYGYKPTRIAVALDALAVFVHKDNPVDQLSLEELDGIFSLNRKSGYGENVKTWGQLGARGNLKGMPISLYGRNSASGTYGYFKKVALFKGDFKKEVKEQPGSSAVVDGVAGEKSGIGYSGIGYLTSSVKAVKLSKKKGGDGYHPTYENVLSGKYPLSRALYIYILKEPNKPLKPLVKEFLKFILSKEGQKMVVKDGYLPLPAKFAERQLNKLK